MIKTFVNRHKVDSYRVSPIGFRDPCGFVALRYVILKFLRVNLFLYRGMNLLIRFFCSEYIIAFTNDKLTIFSWGNRLQFFLALSYGLQFLSTDFSLF